jgi:hypothetical protein
MRLKQIPVVTALVGLVAMLGSLAAAAPAQAAPPETISQLQVNFTTNRYTVGQPYRTKFGVTIELRAGWYEGYQYGWARSAPDWKAGQSVWLRIFENGTWRFVHGAYNEFGRDSSRTTAGQLTRADNNYKFAACLMSPAGNDWDCTPPW